MTDALGSSRVDASKAYIPFLIQRPLVDDTLSLDALQGLLIIVVYSQRYWSSDGESIHPRLTLCTALASDLLYSEERGCRKTQAPNHQEGSVVAEPRDGGYFREVQRVFLACYYVDASLRLIGYGRPEKAGDWDSLLGVATDLAAHGQMPDDYAFPRLIKVCALTKDTAYHLNSFKTTNNLHTGFFALRLGELEDEKSPHPLIDRLVQNTKGFLLAEGQRSSRRASTSFADGAIQDCAEHFDAHLTASYQAGLSALEQLNRTEWAHFLSMLMLFFRLGMCLPVGYIFRKTGQPIRSAIIEHMVALSSLASASQGSHERQMTDKSEGLMS